MSDPFYFFSEVQLTCLLGRRARTVEELLSGLQEVPASSIYYHTHHSLKQHHLFSPEPTNDFAFWLSGMLRLTELGEAVASVDIIRFKRIEDIRKALIERVESYAVHRKPTVTCQEGEEFHFQSCVSFIFQTRYVAENPQQFAECLDYVSVNSLYFHMFEAPLRLQRNENDLSAWFRSIGETDIAERVAHMDPYTITGDSLRRALKKVVTTYARHIP